MYIENNSFWQQTVTLAQVKTQLEYSDQFCFCTVKIQTDITQKSSLRMTRGPIYLDTLPPFSQLKAAAWFLNHCCQLCQEMNSVTKMTRRAVIMLSLCRITSQ